MAERPENTMDYSSQQAVTTPEEAFAIPGELAKWNWLMIGDRGAFAYGQIEGTDYLTFYSDGLWQATSLPSEEMAGYQRAFAMLKEGLRGTGH
jgi:hypothetical protein